MPFRTSAGGQLVRPLQELMNASHKGLHGMQRKAVLSYVAFLGPSFWLEPEARMELRASLFFVTSGSLRV